MKNLLFSTLFMSSAYFIATVSACRINLNSFRNKTILSHDITNVCKGIAILIIMLAHIGNLFGIRYLTPLGSLGVAIFLFLSGYGLECSANKNGLKFYWKKRIISAYIPYAFVELIGIIFRIGPDYKGLGFWDILKDFLLIDIIHPFGWYMQCIFIQYIAFYIAKMFARKNQKVKYIVLLSTSILMFVFFRGLFKQQIFSFVLGVFTAEYYYLIEPKTIKFKYAMIALLVGGTGLLFKQINIVRNFHWIIYYLIYAFQATFLMLGVILLVSYLSNKLNSLFFEIMLRIGLISYELYLYHGLVFSIIAHKNISYPLIIMYFFASFIISTVAYIIRRSFSKNIKPLSFS